MSSCQVINLAVKILNPAYGGYLLVTGDLLNQCCLFLKAALVTVVDDKAGKSRG